MSDLPPPGEIDAVLFDAGETLIFIRPSFVGGYALVCREAGFDISEDQLQPGLKRASAAMEERLRAKPDYRTDEAAEFAQWVEFNRVVFESAGHPEFDPLAMSHRMEEAYESGRLTETLPDTLPTLRRVREAGKRIGIVSNASSGMAKALRHAGVSDLADHISISATVGWEKPGSQIFEDCLRGLRVRPERAVHVGDSLTTDGLGARAAGLGGFVHFANGERFHGRDGGPTIRSLGELIPLLGLG